MLIWVAGGLTVFLEECVVLGVCNYVNGQLTAEFKPLRPFPPLIELDVGQHVAAVATTPIAGGVIVGLNKTVVRIDQVFINYWEVVDGDAAL